MSRTYTGIFSHFAPAEKAYCDIAVKVDAEDRFTDTLKEEYWTPENQLWLCTGGFGSHPRARGRAVYATCLGDGEEARWNRSDFLGVLKEKCMPAWAKEKLERMNAPQEYSLGGQTM